MACENQVGVKNIMLTFRDCDTDETFGPLSHELATEDLPVWRTCTYTNEPLQGGFVRRTPLNPGVEINVIRDLRVPLALYQGCADVTIQVEYFNGLVYSGMNGMGVGEERSDAHEVTMDLSFKEIDELLPEGQLQA